MQEFVWLDPGHLSAPSSSLKKTEGGPDMAGELVLQWAPCHNRISTTTYCP